MKKWLLFVCIGINQLELAYSYVHADASLDSSLVIAGAKLSLNQGMLDYTRYFGSWHRLTCDPNKILNLGSDRFNHLPPTQARTEAL